MTFSISPELYPDLETIQDRVQNDPETRDAIDLLCAGIDCGAEVGALADFCERMAFIVNNARHQVVERDLEELDGHEEYLGAS